MLTKAEIEAALEEDDSRDDVVWHPEFVKQALRNLLSAREDAARLAKIVRDLWTYGTLRPVDGVVYPTGTHRDVLDRARAALAAHEALGGGE